MYKNIPEISKNLRAVWLVDVSKVSEVEPFQATYSSQYSCHVKHFNTCKW